MASLVIKDLPADLHARLKAQAAKHHRSMTKEAVSLLEAALDGARRVEEPPPVYQGRFPLTTPIIDKAREDGRS